MTMATFAFFALTCLSATSEDSAPGWIADHLKNDFVIEALEFGGKRCGEVCKSFEITAEQAKRFLERARVIDGYTFGKEYPWFPCWFEGVLHLSGKELEWRVGPGATGTVRFGDEVLYLVCETDCREDFPESGRLFDD